MGDTGGGNDVVLHVEIDLAFLVDEQFQEIQYILTEHETGIFGYRRWQVGFTNDGNALVINGFTIFSHFATMTAPFFISSTVALWMMRGACLPGIWAVQMITSAVLA